MLEWLWSHATSITGRLIKFLFPKAGKKQSLAATNPKDLVQQQGASWSPVINNSPGASLHSTNIIVEMTGIQPDNQALKENTQSFTSFFKQEFSGEEQQKFRIPQNWLALSKAYSQAAAGLEQEIQKTIILGLREKINNDQSTPKGLYIKLAQEKIDKLSKKHFSILTLAWLLRHCQANNFGTKEKLLRTLEESFHDWRIFIPNELAGDDLDYLDSIGCIEISRNSPVITKYPSLTKYLAKRYGPYLDQSDLESKKFLKPYEEFWNKFHLANTSTNTTGIMLASWFYEAKTGKKIQPI